MNKKYVIQAFELNLKGRFDVLLRYYGDTLFQVPAQIMVSQIKDELGITLTEQSIYTLKKRIKRASVSLPAQGSGTPTPTLPKQSPLFAPPDKDWGSIVENATKQPKGEKDQGLDFTDF
ncbi:hypothetical protein FEM33_15050 [Dyadobacter flavalbus]|uniref:Uncharacterized protein n=1 Tax=Dyadobacter flavalbus TaxID=2579942 RepID=A0A5M8QY88_9BACT|nr:hypothetical protein [Dyadobacter flavalbus]KAA6438952.1 hypothetical protein FEM33_15050 [Dyadobacter flavalbus]